MVEFEILKGKTIIKFVDENDKPVTKGSHEMFIHTNDGVYKMYHEQDDSENVEIEDICEDLNDVIGSEILLAEEVVHEGDNPNEVTIPENQDSFTWTFYKLSTQTGSVTIRWYGESNGYYSERVHFKEIGKG